MNVGAIGGGGVGSLEYTVVFPSCSSVDDGNGEVLRHERLRTDAAAAVRQDR